MDVDCSDGNECTLDLCDPTDGTCDNPPVTDGTACDLSGVGGSICVSGLCEDARLCEGVDCNDGNACTEDQCDPADGTCDSSPVMDGVRCDFINGFGICTSGVCEDAKRCEEMDCNDGNECTIDLCSPELGTCSNDARPNIGTPCDFGGGVGICRSGVCEGSCTPRTCQQAGAECGDVSDACGGTLECGACPFGEICTNGVCKCSGGTSVLWCRLADATCGLVPNGCGEEVVSCGICPPGMFCVSGSCQSSCQTDCAGKQCGPDGCGGTCGSCPAGESCSSNGVCQSSCQTDCAGKQCGPDGCGGVCGICSVVNLEICVSGSCQSGCQTDCAGKQCGPDGCGGVCGSCLAGESCSSGGVCLSGGVCGSCPPNSTCTADQQSCQCSSGFVPDPTSDACLQIGGPCQTGLTYCAGNNWVWCDTQRGLTAVSCPSFNGTNCRMISSSQGACECGVVDSNGLCGGFPGGPQNEIHFFCLDALNVIAPQNCREAPGGSGRCESFTNSFGSLVTSCFCSSCFDYNSTFRTCTDLCGSGFTCSTLGGVSACVPRF